MHAPNFASVAALSPEEQSRLFEEGDSPERLWSAWAIALRLGREALPLLRSIEGSELQEGLRRQLLVILAGMGERVLLRALAESEQLPSVQATASILYMRTSSDRFSSETTAFALRQLRTAPVEVRRAIVGEQELGQSHLPTSDLIAVLKDADATVRIACAACILKDPSSQGYPDAVCAVVAAFASELDPDVRRAFISKLPRSAVPDILHAIRSDDVSRVLDTLDAALRQFGRRAHRM